MGGMSTDECFAHFGMDPIRWVYPHRPDPARGTYFNPHQSKTGFLETRLISSDHWRIEMDDVPVAGGNAAEATGSSRHPAPSPWRWSPTSTPRG